MPLSKTQLYILAVILAVIIDFVLIIQWRKKRAGKTRSSPSLKHPGRLLIGQSPVLTFLDKLVQPLVNKIPYRLRSGFTRIIERTVRWVGGLPWVHFLELGLITAWAGWVSSPLLVTPPNTIPYGGEFANLTQTHTIWTLLPRCGLCILWNGSINGGAPAFAELTGAILHPFIFIPVLLWGVAQGAKVTYFVCLALAGMAQWGLARALGLGWWSRMWSGLLIVVGGHLSSKMENGDIGLVLGLACAALALTFGVDLLYNRNRKSLVWLAVALVLTLLSGEGYIQVAVVLTLLPTLALLCFNKEYRQPAWKDYLLALVLAALLGGIFLAPLLHFLPEMSKDSDVTLSNFPPLEYLPLNLVIRDLKFHRTEILGKDPYLATHMIYIGWAPVLLALASLRLVPARLNRLMWIFITGIALVFLITSSDLPRALLGSLPVIGQLRHLTVASGLVIPMIVGLAAISLDALLKRLTTALQGWHLFASYPARVKAVAASLPGYLTMAAIAFFSISPCYNLSQKFLDVRELDYLKEHVQALKTPSAQWVQPPYGFYEWTLPVLESGMKIGHTWRPWHWEGRDQMPPYIEVVFLPNNQTLTEPYQQIGDYGFIRSPIDEYAYVLQNGAVNTAHTCQAVSQGGWIDVNCSQPHPGQLIVRENDWQGWYAWVDGKPTHLVGGTWLQVQALPGEHHYTFRYLPWDVALGAILTLAGIGLAVVIHLKV